MFCAYPVCLRLIFLLSRLHGIFTHKQMADTSASVDQFDQKSVSQTRAEDAETRTASCFRKLCGDIFGDLLRYVRWENNTVNFIPVFCSYPSNAGAVVASLQASLSAINSWEVDGIKLNVVERVSVLTHFWKQVSKWTTRRPDKCPMGEAYQLVNNSLVRFRAFLQLIC